MTKKYRIIKSEEEALMWLNDNYKEFITKNQQELNKENTLANALYCYTGNMSSDYSDIFFKANGNIDEIKLDSDMQDTDCIFHKDTLQNIRLIYEEFKYISDK